MASTILKNLPIAQPVRQIYRRLYKKLDWWTWCGKAVWRYGRPNIMLYFEGGLGDALLCTTVFHELRQRGYQGLWMMSRHSELFLYNKDIDAVVPEDDRYRWLTLKLKGRQIFPYYAPHIKEENRDLPLPRHIISYMCQLAGITGEVTLKPYFLLLDKETEQGQLVSQQIAIQSSGLGARYHIATKEWYPERFQTVVSALKSKYNFVQLGTPSDPPLEGALDLRGKTSIRQTAAILSRSLVFVGQIGFLMHLARAVDCRSVIVYGGRELPSQSGYSCNENISSIVECAPCWRYDCDRDLQCMNGIGADMVVEAVERQVEQYGKSLPVDIYVIS